MATTVTALTPIGFPFPFIGIGVPAAQLTTFIPSAELIYTANESITVAGAGEDQQLTISCALPASFAYVLVESSFRIRGVDSADWNAVAGSELSDSTGGPNRVSIPLAYKSEGVHNDTTTQIDRQYRLLESPTKLLVPKPSDNAFFSVEVFNPNIDGTSESVKFYARFLRYDRNQAQFWQVNTPVYTR